LGVFLTRTLLGVDVFTQWRIPAQPSPDDRDQLDNLVGGAALQTGVSRCRNTGDGRFDRAR
jgi:hypothetical protein